MRSDMQDILDVPYILAGRHQAIVLLWELVLFCGTCSHLTFVPRLRSTVSRDILKYFLLGMRTLVVFFMWTIFNFQLTVNNV
jgi:hypothetical protein